MLARMNKSAGKNGKKDSYVLYLDMKATKTTSANVVEPKPFMFTSFIFFHAAYLTQRQFSALIKSTLPRHHGP